MGMPSNNGHNGGILVPYEERLSEQSPSVVYTVHHCVKGVPRILLSWNHGNCLRVSYLAQPPSADSNSGTVATLNAEADGGGKVVEIQLGKKDESQGFAEKRRIAYVSVQAFAYLQNQKQQLFQFDTPNRGVAADWWQNVLEYSHSISATLGSSKGPAGSAVHRSSDTSKEPTTVKAVWDLLEIFYVDKNAASWLPERLVDWLASYDGALPSATLQSKLVKLQQKLVNLRFPEDDAEYWEGVASALAVGWLDIVINLLRMHGSYQHDQIDNRSVENGLVETVAVLISKMPRLRPSLPAGAPGIAFNFKPEFAKEWERWRMHVAKLDGSDYWEKCNHHNTLQGLKKLLKLLLGSMGDLVSATSHWMELLVAHLLHVQPFSKVSEGLAGYAIKCVESKANSSIDEAASSNDPLQELMLAILGDDTEVVVAECSRVFDPWFMSHVMELLTAKSKYAQALLGEERDTLGGISLEELHRLFYAQVLASHPLTWQVQAVDSGVIHLQPFCIDDFFAVNGCRGLAQLAPVYLSFCPREGLGMLESLLLKQPVSSGDCVALKALEVCRLYDLEAVATTINRVAGVHNWKHGRKGAGIAWLQRAHDDRRLSAVADELLASVSAGITGAQTESLKHLEGLVDLLGPELHATRGLSFLHRYREFKVALQSIWEMRSKVPDSQKLVAAARQAADSLLQLLKPQVTPQRFWLPLLCDSVELLEWPEQPLLNAGETHVLLSRLQELSLAKVRGDVDGINPRDLVGPSIQRVRLALACNLGRAILQE